MWFENMLNFIEQGLLNGSVWEVLVFTLVVTHITIASVTIFLHRCQAHRALDLHAIPSHFFRFWLWLTTGQVTKEWAAIHRKHHAKCETEEDPHSPQTRGINTVLWKGAELYRSEAKVQATIEKYGHGTPNDWVEKNIYSRFVWQGVALMLIIDFLLFGALGLTVWAIQMMWIPFFAAGVINGIGHYWGYRNYDSPDASRNISPWGILIGGEELHNNHHTHGTSAKLSSKWYEFDIGWMYIRILEILKLAKVKKLAPEPKFQQAKVQADMQTLDSVITNRYDVMANYAQSLRKVWNDELESLREKVKSLQLEKTSLKEAKKFLQIEPSQLAERQVQKLSEVLEHSKTLKTMHEMRAELAAIWERSTISREQLLALLQDWCKRAEDSGIQLLQDFSRRLRSYA